MPEKIKVIRKNHPLEGKEFKISFGGQNHLTVILEDGSTMRIPRAWTNADKENSATELADDSIFSIDSIRELIEVFGAVKDKARVGK